MLKTTAQAYLQNLLVRIHNENLRQDVVHTTNSVMLRKRYRDMTPDDSFGLFDNYGTWVNTDARNLERLNIIKPMIKGVTAAITSANVKVNVQPRVADDSRAEMVADVSRAIRDLKTEEQWTHQMNEQIATEPQVAPGVFLQIDWNAHAKNNFVSSVDEWDEDESPGSSKGVCKQCGYEVEVNDEIIPDEMGMATTECPECGGEAEITEIGETEKMPVISSAKTFKSGNTETRVIPSSEVVMDAMGTQGGNIRAAKWMLHRYLVPTEELLAEYPEMENNIRGSSANFEWSYALRWQYTLQTGNDMPFRDQTQMVEDLKEVKDLYQIPRAYQHVRLTSDLIIGDPEKPRYIARTGQGFGDGLFNGKPLPEGTVLCFRMVGSLIIDVFPYDFRECFIYITFLSNPSAFKGLFLTEMLPIQNVVNYMWTVQVLHTRRNARTTKILNSGAFNPEDVEKDVVLTKEPFPYDQNINNSFGEIKAATLSDAPSQIINTALALAPQIGGVTPAMTGQSQPGETYSAVRQQKEMSMGQITPFSISIALAKTQWTLRQLKEAQEHWAEEDFLFLLKMNGEWTEEYIEAFLEANLDTDIICDYERGSEAPRNLLDREMALRQFIGDLSALTELSMTGSPLAKPELLENILKNIKQFTQIDVDVANSEIETRLADSRYDKICHIVEQMQIPPGTNPQALQIMAAQIIQLPDLVPSQYEEVGIEIEFFRDKISREKSKDSPNFLLVACCEAQIKALKMAGVVEGQENITAEMAVQAPAQEQQAQIAAQQQEAQAQQIAQQQQAEQGDKQAERQSMREEKLEDAKIRAMEREHESELRMKEQKTAKAA